MFEILTAQNLIALLTLTSLEIVLGIDNIVFIAILTAKLPKEKQPSARRLGLAMALVMRILLLISISWVIKLTEPLFEFFSNPISGRDLILLGGGLFLIAKATYEIHHTIDTGGTAGQDKTQSGGTASAASVITQIAFLDIIFSLDSVITAVGMADSLFIMVTAVLISIGVMMAFANPISEFILKHPTIKMLALAFLILIGAMLVAEGWGQHVEKAYIYFAMAFSLAVEILNYKMRKKAVRSS